MLPVDPDVEQQVSLPARDHDQSRAAPERSPEGLAGTGSPETGPPYAVFPPTRSAGARSPIATSATVKPPQVKAPQVKAPQVKAPQVKAPQVKAPQAKSPDPEQAQSSDAKPAAAEPADAKPAAADSTDAGAPKAQAPRVPAGAVAGEPPGVGPVDPADETVIFAMPVPAQAPPDQPASPRGAEKLPSWPRVLATTISLWAQRRLHRRSRPARGRGRWILVLVLVAAVAVAAITIVLAGNRGPARSSALAAAAKVRSEAASWAARQIASDAIVACDPAMCSVLHGQGIPASRLLELGSGTADPLGSDVVMATAAVRSQFGPRLASVYAPVVLVSFGTGSARIVIRVIAPDGAQAYLAAMRSDVQARTAAGLQLLHNPRLHASPAAQRQLAAGQVDARLLTTLATLAALHPVDIARFSGAGAQASVGVPLRSADISGAAGVAATRSAASLSSLKAFLLAQRAPYLPAEMDIVRLATGQAVLRVEFTAPSPLGLLAAGS